MRRLSLPTSPRPAAAAALLAALAAASAPAWALFDDNEARRAIIDLRSRFEQQTEQQRQRQAATDAQLAEQTALLRRSLLELNAQLEQLRAEMARLRGDNEQLAREVAELQRKQRDIAAGVDDRIRRLEPVKVSVDDKEFLADPEEKRQFEEAMAVFRNGRFPEAAAAFNGFVRRYPGSGYKESALFWLGNAQYGAKQYKEAISSFRAMLTASPDHPKAPEALLSIANTQIELKDTRAARATLTELTRQYPKSEAAAVGKDRLASLR